MSSYRKEVKRLVSDLRELGLQVETNGGGHLRVLKDGQIVPGLVIAASPSDRRWYMNVVRDLKRSGVVDRDPRSIVTGMRYKKKQTLRQKACLSE